MMMSTSLGSSRRLGGERGGGEKKSNWPTGGTDNKGERGGKASQEREKKQRVKERKGIGIVRSPGGISQLEWKKGTVVIKSKTPGRKNEHHQKKRRRKGW